MNRFLVTAALAICACGPPDTGPATAKNTIQIENNYADSIFTVDVTPSVDGGSIRVFDQVRVAGDTAASETFEGNGAIHVAVDAISLGDHHGFTIDTTVDAFGTLQLTYDFDLALGDFGLKYKWIGP